MYCISDVYNHLVVRCHSMILPNILVMVVSSNVVILIVLK